MKSSTEDHLERLEMAQIKLEVTLETSNKWWITGDPILCWQKKLKHAAEECDNKICRCPEQLVEDIKEEINVWRSAAVFKEVQH